MLGARGLEAESGERLGDGEAPMSSQEVEDPGCRRNGVPLPSSLPPLCYLTPFFVTEVVAFPPNWFRVLV